jgi:hypothetical protein
LKRFGDLVVIGFIISLIAGMASGIPGMAWLQWVAVIGILPFMVVVAGALLDTFLRIFRR